VCEADGTQSIRTRVGNVGRRGEGEERTIPRAGSAQREQLNQAISDGARAGNAHLLSEDGPRETFERIEELRQPNPRSTSYDAGENRVAQWRAEKPDLAEDEFIDDIPFPETQNYVKRILGTAEDYRLLYGRDGGRPQSPVLPPK